MASVDWHKIKNMEKLKQILRHCDKESREKNRHSNPDLDTGKTRYNIQGESCGYRQAFDRATKRLAELDAMPKANLRSDRVVAFGLEFTEPKALMQEPDEVRHRWCRKAVNTVKNVLSSWGVRETDVLGWYVHDDERHDYLVYDDDGLRERHSRGHVHILVMPVMNERLNGRGFSAKSHMNQMNRAVHDMSLGEFGVEFMDGTRRKGGKSVELLKEEQKIRQQAGRDADEIRQKAIAEAERIRREADQYAGRKRKKIKSQLKEVSGALEEVNQLLADIRSAAENRRFLEARTRLIEFMTEQDMQDIGEMELPVFDSVYERRVELAEEQAPDPSGDKAESRAAERGGSLHP